MALNLSQNYTAIIPGATFVQFLASGGTPPYSYSVIPGGAGGSINSSNGNYVAPPTMTAYPANRLFDTIQVIDSLAAMAIAQILVGTPIFLFCDVIQNQMGLDPGRVWLWDQKIFQLTDSDLYIAVSEMSCKPFGNTIRYEGSASSFDTVQVVNMYSLLDIDIISRGPSARDRKEEVIMALNSIYSQQQQEANGFYIGKISPDSKFINLSQIDGAAIPYRYKISVAMQYAKSKVTSVPFFDQFSDEVDTNP